HQLDELRLAAGPRLAKQTVEMGFDRCPANAESCRGLRHPAPLDACQQNAQLRRSKVEHLGNRGSYGPRLKNHLADQYNGRNLSAACRRTKRQHLSNVTLIVASPKREGGAPYYVGTWLRARRLYEILKGAGAMYLAGSKAT